MHIDYAKETLASHLEADDFLEITEQDALEAICIDEIVDLAEKVGDDKIKSIAETMKQSSGYRSVRGRKKITSKQQYAVSKFLLAKFGSAEAVIENAYK